MQKQNFENKVKQKMEELSFVPSEPVWHKIEEGIKKKKERRRILFWILIPMMLLSVGGYLYLSNTEEEPKSSASTNVVKEPETSNTQEEKNINQTVKSSTVTSKESDLINKKDLAEYKDSKRTSSEKYTSKPGINVSSLNKIISIKNKSVNIKSIEDGSVVKLDGSKEVEEQKNSDIKNLVSNDTTIIINNAQAIDSANFTKKDSSKAIVKPVDTALVETVKVDDSQNKKLQLGINVKFGISGIADGIFNLFNSSLEKTYSGAIGNSGTQRIPPDPVVRNASFAVGLAIKKQISNKSALLSGINYNYYSTNRKVGEVVQADTAVQYSSSIVRVDNYYRNNSRNNNYTTHYHFIELPFAFEYSPFKKLPLNINAGVSVLQMLSNNNLVYNPAPDIYFKNDDNVNKTQLHLSGGFNVGLLKKSKSSLFIGPQFQYGLKSLNKNSDQKLFFLGLQSKFYFKKQ